MAVKLAKKKVQKENDGKVIVRSLLEYLCALWAIVMAFAVTLYMEKGYYKIGTVKYDAYAHVFVFGMPVLLLLVILYLVFVRKERRQGGGKTIPVKQQFSLTDGFVLVYLAVSLVSFAFCGNYKEAFWGYDGWFMGLFSQITFVVIYFVFSRFLKDYPVVFGAVCVVTLYVFVMGVLNRLLLDPLGVYENLSDYYINQFLSTLGQASWYSSYMTVVLPVGMFGFWYFKNVYLRILTGIFTLIGFATLVTQNTDSAYFGFLAAMLVLFHVSAADAKKMQRLFEVALLFALAPKFMWFLLKIHPNEILELDTISEMFVFAGWTWALIPLCAALLVLFWALDKKGTYPVRAMKIFRRGVYLFFVCAIGLWALILAVGATGKLPGAMAVLTERIPYLTWDDSWGNGRGFTWSVTAKMLGEMNFGHVLVGVGPDCFADYGYRFYEELIRSKWGDAVLANAHNEWLNAFVNFGWLGGISYLGIFVSAMIRYMKRSETQPVLIAVTACVAAYMAHNVFCYQQVLCTPFIFLFMAMAEYQIRKNVE